MNISENKTVVALSAVFALAFGGVAYYGFTRTQDYAQAQKELSTISDQFEDYNNAEVPPTRKNREALKAAFAQVNQVDKELRQQLEAYAAVCHGDGKKLSAQDMQNMLRDNIARIGNLAGEKGAVVSSPAADLGMAAFKNSAPVEADVPFRAFQLRAVSRVAEVILNSGASVLDKVYCAPLPEAAEETAKGSRKAPAYFPLSFEVAFEATRGVLPQVINTIVNDKDYMLFITGVSVKGMENLPGIDPYQAPGGGNVGDDIGQAASQGNGARSVAKRLTGDPKERARVHLNMQVLYFNSAQNK
ncbi:MAG: hypothetical protein ACI4OS_04805 [Akkermansia sp.]